MFSSNKNVELICQLVRDAKDYGLLRLERFELDMASKLARLIGILVMGALLTIVLLVVMVFVSLAVGYALGKAIGSTALAMLIIAVAYLLLAVVIYAKRHAWIVTPLTLMFHDIFLTENDDTDHDNE